MYAEPEHIADNRKDPEKGVTKFLREYGIVLVAVMAAGILMKMFVLDAIVIPSHSMENTLLVGDYVFIDKLISHQEFTSAETPFTKLFASRTIERGDVIVFKFPELQSPEDGSLYIKRCIAKEGDEISMLNGEVYVNGERIISSDHGESFDPLTVPYRGMVISLTKDNYALWAPVIRREGHSIIWDNDRGFEIDGAFVSTYTIQKNYLFVLGDNLDHSYDSRSWGFLPFENVVGRALMVYWSMNNSAPMNSVSDVVSSIRWNRICTMIR